MKSFNLFLNKLLENPTNKTLITIRGKKRKIIGMARFTSINYKGEEYIKVTFSDKSGLVVIPSEKEIYFSEESIKKAEGIPNYAIGKENIKYKNRTYKLDNKNDYQFCLQVYFGQPNKDIEGECEFSDYISDDGLEILSLGWLSVNGERADVLAKKLTFSEIDI